MIKKCLHCDTDIEKKYTESVKFFNEKRKYCSHSCRAVANPTRYWLGKKMSEENRKLLGLRVSGAKHWNWKGGEDTVKERRVHYERNRNLRKNGNGGSHTMQDWDNLKEKYKFTCPCCLTKEPEIKLTKDHILPLSVGGRNDIKNIQPLCRRCNSVKATKQITYNIPLALAT